MEVSGAQTTRDLPSAEFNSFANVCAIPITISSALPHSFCLLKEISGPTQSSPFARLGLLISHSLRLDYRILRFRCTIAVGLSMESFLDLPSSVKSRLASTYTASPRSSSSFTFLSLHL